ncbi:hypothetical protein QUB37_07855 [Microcoleus sp. AT3-A2]
MTRFYYSDATGNDITFAAKLEIGVWRQKPGGKSQNKGGRRKEPEEVFLQI